jgi:hypothetical protein
MNHSPFALLAIGLLEWDKADRRVKVILALEDRDGL